VQLKRISVDTKGFEDNTERFERWKQDNISVPPSLGEAAVLLSQLQQSVRLLSGDLNHDSLGKVLKGIGRETDALAQIFTANQLPLMSALSASVGKLAMKCLGDVKSLDASTLRTLSHALDSLRSYTTDKVSRIRSQKLPIHVLVVDDEPVCRKIMQRALGTESVDVVLCETAEHALNCLDAYNFDVVFSDIMMPEADGFAFIKRLREFKTHANTPVIFVTAFDDLMTRSKSRLAGGCDFIAKPIKPAEVTVKAITFAWRSRLSHGLEKVESKREPMPTAPPENVFDASPPGRSKSPVGVITINPGGLIESISRDGAKILGYAAEELVNSEAGRLLSEPGQSVEAKDLKVSWLAQQAQKGTSTLLTARRKNGENVSIQVRVSKSGTAGSARFICLFTANPETSK
jgi:PAS domain S-box-containing protein